MLFSTVCELKSNCHPPLGDDISSSIYHHCTSQALCAEAWFFSTNSLTLSAEYNLRTGRRSCFGEAEAGLCDIEPVKLRQPNPSQKNIVGRGFSVLGLARLWQLVAQDCSEVEENYAGMPRWLSFKSNENMESCYCLDDFLACNLSSADQVSNRRAGMLTRLEALFITLSVVFPGRWWI